jgi:hypothetical protein
VRTGVEVISAIWTSEQIDYRQVKKRMREAGKIKALTTKGTKGHKGKPQF